MSKCSTNQENCGIQCIVQFEGDRLWMLCREKLLNAAVVQSKLERHVEAKHQCVVCWWGEITPKEALSHKKKKRVVDPLVYPKFLCRYGIFIVRISWKWISLCMLKIIRIRSCVVSEGAVWHLKCEAALFHICLLKVIKMKKSGGVE